MRECLSLKHPRDDIPLKMSGSMSLLLSTGKVWWEGGREEQSDGWRRREGVGREGRREGRSEGGRKEIVIVHSTALAHRQSYRSQWKPDSVLYGTAFTTLFTTLSKCKASKQVFACTVL